MVGKKTNTIGIADRYIMNENSDPFKVQLVEPLIHAARVRHRHVLYYSGHVDEDGFTSFLDGRSDGLICITGSIDQEEAAAFLQTGLPVVFIGTSQSQDEGRHAAGIDVDNEMGAYLGVSHLTSLGHRRIAMLQGVGISGNEQRVAGYRRALSEAGIDVEERLIYPTIAWDVAAYNQVIQALADPHGIRPTAIFCFNDVLAFAALKAASDCGVKVPERLSIVGFDDVAHSAVTNPPLTTVRQPLAWIGERAVEILIEIIENRLPRNYHEQVEPTLIVRKSTSPPETVSA
jgi:LacI family transcriptional regulator